MVYLALHLLHGHLSRAPVHVLHKAAAFAWWNLCVHNVSIPPKKASQIFLSDAAAEGSNEEGGVICVELTNQSCNAQFSVRLTTDSQAARVS